MKKRLKALEVKSEEESAQAAAPKNEIEGALAIQMACSHSAAMAMLGKIGSAGYPVSAYATAAATLMRTYTLQLEALRRLRGTEAQHIRVGHVHINDEGRAVIGGVALGGLRGPLQGRVQESPAAWRPRARGPKPTRMRNPLD